MGVHRTAIIGEGVELDPTVDVGAYAILEPGVRIGAGTRVYPHAYISTGATIGQRCQIHPFAVVGHLPQDLAFAGEPTFTQVGDETIIREGVTIHRGTAPGSTTIVGRRCFLMANAHVGHNCRVEDDVKMANGALLAGHVHVGRGSFLSGNAVVHQYVRIGEMVMVGGGLRVTMDIPPFMMYGPRGVVGPNVIGLRRAGLSAAERHELRECHRVLFRAGAFRDAITHVESMVQSDAGRRLVEFLRAPSRRGISGFARRGETAAAESDVP
jgi:UDP-N-acetylglucosamine acyltransferase